ncbi:MAG: metallophosphoesterase [Candidatus Dormibacteraeota bacterium]|nr:metallophosphoesterase [Candidatus Dormibacteraeota bacterium]
MNLPFLLVGDVHGDLERLFEALRPYPATDFRTIFLGDLVDGGPFGVGSLRYARDRPNSVVLIGNHEALMLAALSNEQQFHRWLISGGEKHDLEELRGDPGLEAWLRARPAMVTLADGTLIQHADNDGYWDLAGSGSPESINSVVADMLAVRGHEHEIWDALSPRAMFQKMPGRLERWLERTGADRVAHGHTPHQRPRPEVYGHGRAINLDGGLSRYGRSRYRKLQPVQASVAPLDLDAPWLRS